jgi:hypothetical protein
MSYLSPPDYSYTLSELPVSPDPLAEFIFAGKRGNCEYFASAMAVMLRAAGVPSRLIAGYHGGIYNESGGYYIVNQSNAHVWVEAWDNTENLWRRYDPTPFSNEGGDGSDGAGKLSLFWMYVDYINYRMSRLFLEYERDTQSMILDAIRGFFANPGAALGAAIEKYSLTQRETYVITSILSVMLFLALVLKYIRRRLSLVRSRDQILRDRFLDAMERAGFLKKSSEGLEEFVEAVRVSPGVDPEIHRLASEFVLTFEKFYFKDQPVDGRDREKLEKLTRLIAGGQKR